MYPSDLNLMRTFMNSLTSNENSFELSLKSFLSSCSKYGIDCPFPFVVLNLESSLDPENGTIDHISLKNRCKISPTKRFKDYSFNLITTSKIKQVDFIRLSNLFKKRVIKIFLDY